MKRVALGVAAAVAVCVVIVAIPVVRISTAVPGTNPGSVDQAHALIDRYQRDGADPGQGNAHDILAEVCPIARELKAEQDARFRDEVASDEILFEYLMVRRAEIDPRAIHRDAMDFQPGDWGYEHADTINAAHRRHALAWVDAYRESGVPERLDDLAQTWYARRTQQPGLMIHTLLPELGTSRVIGRTNTAAMWMDAHAGDGARAVSWFERSIAISRVIGHQTSLIERLVAIAILTESFLPARALAVRGHLGPEDLRGMLAAMDRHLPLPPDELGFEGERLWLLDAIERTYSDDGNGSGYLLLLELNWLGDENAKRSPSVLNTPGLLLPRKREVVTYSNDFYDEFLSLVRTERWNRDFTIINEYEDLLDTRYRLTPVSVLLPALGKALRAMDCGRTHVGGTALVFAVELYRQEHGGDLPASLADLVPEYLREVPIDPFASDGMFRYEVIEDSAAYVLYSVGFDGRDDGGHVDEENPGAALTNDAWDLGGIDYVFNRPATADSGD